MTKNERIAHLKAGEEHAARMIEAGRKAELEEAENRRIDELAALRHA